MADQEMVFLKTVRNKDEQNPTRERLVQARLKIKELLWFKNFRFFQWLRNPNISLFLSLRKLLDDFKLNGVNGEHKVMVFETLGPNLDKWLAKPEATGFPLECVKQMSKQLLEGVGIN